MLDIKFHGTENPHQHVRNSISAMTLKGIDKDIFHIIFPSAFDKDVMRWYITMTRERSWIGMTFVRNFYVSIDIMLAY